MHWIGSPKFYHRHISRQDVRGKSTACDITRSQSHSKGRASRSAPATLLYNCGPAMPVCRRKPLMRILNIAAYRFVALDDLAQLRSALRERAEGLRLKGTILLAAEGINLILAGAAADVEDFLRALCADARFATIEIKRSWSAGQSFRRLLVKVKREIVSLRRPEINPCEVSAPRLAPQDLKRWLDEGRDFVLLDARNQFEVELGSFDNALALGLKSFSDFPGATPALPA